MEYLNPFLFWVHLLALAISGAAVFGIPLVGARIATATPEMRPTLFGIANQLSSLGRVALVLLLASGPLLFWLKWGWIAPSWWFWLKMALVLALVVLVAYSGVNAKRAQGGDMAAAKRAPQLSMIGVALYLMVIASAVLTFS
jgi:protoporphyrinogen IX oxidase